MNSRWSARSRRLLFILAVLAIGGTAMLGFAQSPSATAEKASPPMQQFVLLFRPGPRPLSEADLKKRADAVLVWAQLQNEQGRKLDPRTLGKERLWIAPDSVNDQVAPADVGSLGNLLFLEARDYAEAVEIARSHPGLHFGTSVEVRAWSRPAGAASLR